MYQLLIPLVSLAAILYVPGMALARGLGIRGLLAMAAAPVMSLGVLGALSVTYSLVDVRWSPWSVVPALAAITGGALIIACYRGRKRANRQLRAGQLQGVQAESFYATAPRLRWWEALALAGGAGALMVALLAAMRVPDALPQAWDGIYHVNGIAQIAANGDASPLGGMDSMYAGLRGVYYPTGFHSLAVLVAQPVIALNAVFLVTILIWVTGLVSMVRVAMPSSPYVAVFAALMAPAASMFPFNPIWQGQYPYFLSLAQLPTIIALTVFVANRIYYGYRINRTVPTRWWISAALSLGLALAGGVSAHGSAVFGLIVVGFLPAVIIMAQITRRLYKIHYRLMATITASLVGLIIIVVIYLFTRDAIASMSEFEREHRSLWTAAGVSYAALYRGSAYKAIGLVLFALTLAGTVFAATRKRTVWVFLGSVQVLVVVLLADSGLGGPLSVLTGPWWAEASRVQGFADSFYVCLGAIGAARTVEYLRDNARFGSRRVAAVGFGALSAALVVNAAAFPLSFGYNQRLLMVYQPEKYGQDTYVTDTERQSLEKIGAYIEPGLVSVGARKSPATLLPAYAARETLYPQLHSVAPGSKQFLIESTFYQLNSNSRVCSMLEDLRVGYYIEVEPRVISNEVNTRASGGISSVDTSVDTSVGMELVKELPGLKLWKINGCEKFRYLNFTPAPDFVTTAPPVAG